MPRRKRQNPLLAVAQRYLCQHLPELRDARPRIRMLDGPPGSPRYAVTVEACRPVPCPHGVPRAVADAGECPIRDCPIRNTVRLLLDLEGEVVQVTRSGIHWG
jgi:hypothetical protein